MDELEDNQRIHKVNKINNLAKKIGLKKEFRDELKKIPEFKCNIRDYCPIIYVNGLSKFLVNIGGSPFMVKERHIRTGLLKNGI